MIKNILYIYELNKKRMVVISKRVIMEFSEEEPKAAEPLAQWYRETKKGDWSNFPEMKKSFNSVDAVGNDLYVFNIGGNKYRLIARIIFRARTIFIRFIGTHKEYDEINLDNF